MHTNVTSHTKHRPDSAIEIAKHLMKRVQLTSSKKRRRKDYFVVNPS